MQTCLNHPYRKVKARELCSTCYDKDQREKACPERRVFLKEQRKHYNSIYNPRRHRRPYHLKYSYGLSEQDYYTMLDKQNDKCYCCGAETKLVVDHNHDTGKVRKLLCYRCNSIAGALEDKRCQSVIEYLKEHE